MSIDIILIDVPEFGGLISVSRSELQRLIHRNMAYYESCGYTTSPYEERRFANEFILRIEKIQHCIPVFYTKKEKLARMRRGWRSYSLPVITKPVLAVRRHLQTNLGNRNIGCRNFHKCRLK